MWPQGNVGLSIKFTLDPTEAAYTLLAVHQELYRLISFIVLESRI